MKNNFEQLSKLRLEKKDLEERLERFDRKPTITIDGVQGSSKEYPYTQHNCKIEGINNKARNQYIKMIRSKDYKIGKLIKQIEYDLNSIEDTEIRQIIRYKYEDDLNWIQIMHKMGYNSEEKARLKLKRFLQKN